MTEREALVKELRDQATRRETYVLNDAGALKAVHDLGVAQTLCGKAADMLSIPASDRGGERETALILLCRNSIMDAIVGRQRYTVNELLEKFDAAVAAIPQSEGPSKSKLLASSDAGGGPILPSIPAPVDEGRADIIKRLKIFAAALPMPGNLGAQRAMYEAIVALSTTTPEPIPVRDETALREILAQEFESIAPLKTATAAAIRLGQYGSMSDIPYRVCMAALRRTVLGGVGAETISKLLALLNPLHGELDLQTYDEKRRENFDAPADAKYTVEITARMERDLSEAVLVLEQQQKSIAPAPLGEDEREIEAYIRNQASRCSHCCDDTKSKMMNAAADIIARLSDNKIITIDPNASTRALLGSLVDSTLGRSLSTETPYIKVYAATDTPHHHNELDAMQFRIPGRSAARGEITHKTLEQMNRKERRAFLSNKRCQK